MAKQYVYSMHSKIMVPVKKLVDIEGTIAGTVLVCTSTNAGCVTSNWSGKIVFVGVEYIVGDVCSKLKVIKEIPLEISARTDIVARNLIYILLCIDKLE